MCCTGIEKPGHFQYEEGRIMGKKLLVGICVGIFVLMVISCRDEGGSSSASLEQQRAGGLANTLTYIAPVDYTPDISLHTAYDISATRTELIRYIFASDTLPDTLPQAEGDRMKISMQNGFISHMSVYRPLTPNGALVIYHDGHDGYTVVDAIVIRRFVANGYTVWRLDLPCIGDNREPVMVDLPRIGRVPITQHEEMIFLNGLTIGSPARYFLEPVIAAVNLAQARGFRDIFMVGLSGGGWTTTLAAALDTRITASYPVAGSVPMAMHFDRYQKNWGDWEQVIPDLYQIASYEDLYIMGSHLRSQIQVLNEYDVCCFNEPRYVLWEPAVQDVLQVVGGEFHVFWAKGDFIHWANPAAVNRILDDMRLRRGVKQAGS